VAFLVSILLKIIPKAVLTRTNKESLGQVILKNNLPFELFLYIYEDGSVEKRIIVE